MGQNVGVTGFDIQVMARNGAVCDHKFAAKSVNHRFSQLFNVGMIRCFEALESNGARG